MPLQSGTQLGPYEILSAAGAGGMGEVYRARDTRLDRTVAIKVLPAHLATDPKLRERFDREARAISSLQHPHICVLHDVGHQEGLDFLVMEYLEGETLATRLEKGPLPAETALPFATQIAEALERAHKHGVVHRDLKPGNVMLTKSGAKVLDFGLAKGQTSATAATAMTAMVTQTKPLTAEGSVVGTFQYMAPEVLEGHEADARSDIFSFGATLYEMLTGRPAFQGKTQASVIASVLASEPPAISTVQPLTPPTLERLVRTCLAKDPDDRIHSAHDLVLQLKWIAEAGSQAGVPAPVAAKRKQREWLAWALAAVALAAAIALGLLYWRSLRQSPPVLRALLNQDPSTRPISTGDNAGPLVISPDGKYVVFLGLQEGSRPALLLRSTTSLTASPLPGTHDARFPFWSPDSKSIGYFQNAKLRTTDIYGNAALTLADAPDARGGSWCSDGTILYAPDTRAGIHRIPATGGTPQQITEVQPPQSTTHRWPHCLPDSKRFLYFSGDHNNVRSESSGIYFALIDGSNPHPVVRSSAGAQYAGGYLLYLRDTSLVAQRLDTSSGQLHGNPQQLVPGVLSDITTWRAVFSASDTGLLVYQSGGALGTELLWTDRAGKVLGSIAGPEPIIDFNLSLDARKVVLSIGDAAPDLWIIDLERGTRNRLTFRGSPNVGGLWSPDGKQIAFMSGRDGRMNLYMKPADGSAEDRPLLPQGEADRVLSDWTRDGRHLLFFEGSPRGDFDIFALPLFGDGKPIKLIATHAFDTGPVVSPDGKWLAYDSNEGGMAEVYVTRFPEITGKWQVSNGGGGFASWGPDGKELFYVAPDRSIVSVPVSSRGGIFEPGTPRVLFRSNAVSTPEYSYQLAADGKRFLINSMDERDSFPVVLVVNWPAELKH